jgi:hypothetical protein
VLRCSKHILKNSIKKYYEFIKVPFERLRANGLFCSADAAWVEDNEVEAIQYELENGLNPNLTFDDVNLLMIAAQMGHDEIVRALVAHDAIDLHAQDKFGNTALHFAALYDHVEVIKILMYADTLADCSCGNRGHRRFVHQRENGYGKKAADLTPHDHVREMLTNPDAYISSHPEEFNEIANWFEFSCPKKAAERARRLEGWGQKIVRTYQHAKEIADTTAQKTKSAAQRAYEKSKKITDIANKKSKKVKQKVNQKVKKAKDYVACSYEKAKDVATDAFDATKEYAAKGYAKTKQAAAHGFSKTTHAVKRAYQKSKAKIVS